MEAILPTQAIHCSQCGGELHPDEGQMFLTCPYCGATIYLDKSKVVFHWYLAPTLDQPKAQAALMRWMAGNQTVKDLDRKSTVNGSTFEYFPMWNFKQRDQNNQESIRLLPAAATSVTEINNMKLPAGDLRKYDNSIDSQAHAPSVPLQAALTWLEQDKRVKEEIIEQSLVHVPLYMFKYQYQGNPYTAVVEAGTGEVFANIYPAKAEAPYRTIGFVSALIFLCLAIIPLVLAAGQGWTGAGIGLAICAGLGIIFIPILFAIARYIAAKV